MYSKVNYTIVGIFVVLFSIGMFWFAFWLAKYGLEEDYHTYRIEMTDSISGLSKDSNVKLRGVDVGRVSEIHIHPDNIEIIEILLDIRQDIPIKEDMKASTKMLGVTGLLSIEIDGGTNEAKTLVPTEDYIPLIASKTSSLSKLMTNLSTMSQKLDQLLSSKNIDTFGTILENVEKVTKKSEVLEDKAMTTLDEFRLSMAALNKDFKQMQIDFAEIKEVTVPTVDKIMMTSQNFNRMTLKVEKSLDRGDYNLKKILEPMLVEIQILSNQLNDMTKSLGQNPSDVFFKSRSVRKGPGE